MRRLLAAGVALLLAAPASSIGAQTSATGMRATGAVVVQAMISGSPVNVGGNVALYERRSLYRLDLLTLGFPGTDPTASAIAGALLAPGGITLLYDGTTGTVTAYSTGNHVFYQAGGPPSTRGTTPAPSSSSVTIGAADPLATLAAVARQLHDVQHAAIQLTGHSTTNGHPTDDLDVTLRRLRAARPVEDYHAQISLADDLDGFPVRIALTSTPPTPQDVGGSLRLDLTAVARDNPDDSVFALPPGLTRVASIGEVLQMKH